MKTLGQVLLLGKRTQSQKSHSVAHCWIKKKDPEKAQLKRAGRSRDPKMSQMESKRKQPSRKPSRRRGPCHVCGAERHIALSALNVQTKRKYGVPKRRVLPSNLRNL